MSSRRVFLTAPLALLGACGFQPVYGPNTGAGGEPVGGGGIGQVEPRLRDEMAAVRVGIIGERNGQLMRRALQRNLEGLAPGSQGRYDLDVSLVFATEVLGYRRDGLVTRIRYIATANWVLATNGVPREIIARNSARTLDAYNLPDLQFFAADASSEDMMRRLIAELSDRVVLGVSVALRQRLAGAPAVS